MRLCLYLAFVWVDGYSLSQDSIVSNVLGIGFDERFETVCTSKQSKQRMRLEVYTVALCGEGDVTSRLCDDLSTQLHLRVPECQATNHSTRRHARMCRIGYSPHLERGEASRSLRLCSVSY